MPHTFRNCAPGARRAKRPLQNAVSAVTFFPARDSYNRSVVICTDSHGHSAAGNRGRKFMKHFLIISLALFSGILATAVIVRSNQKWQDKADYTMRTLTPEILISHCGQPATDISSGSSRRMFYPVGKSVGLIFTFTRTADPRWAYSSFHMGSVKGKELMPIEDVNESQNWAIIEMPCLEGKK